MAVTPSAGNAFLDIRSGSGAIKNLNVAWVSTTTLSVSSGTCVNSTNVSNMSLDTGVTINTANVGLNGMDVGVLGNSTDYYVHLVGNSLNKTASYQGCVVSLSSTNPTLPPGFDTFRLIDYQKTDGSAHFLANYNVGNGNQRIKYWDAAISVLSGGTSATLAAVSLAGATPPSIDNMAVRLSVSFTPATAGDKVSIAPFGSTSTSLPAISSVVAAKAQIAELNVLAKLNSTAATILYINSAASGATTILVTAFSYQL